MQSLLAGRPSQTVKLVCSDPSLLISRVLDPTRPSGYRDAEAALVDNEAYARMDIAGAVEIDVAQHNIDAVVQIVADRVLVPNDAVDAGSDRPDSGTQAQSTNCCRTGCL